MKLEGLNQSQKQIQTTTATAVTTTVATAAATAATTIITNKQQQLQVNIHLNNRRIVEKEKKKFKTIFVSVNKFLKTYFRSLSRHSRSRSPEIEPGRDSKISRVS